MPRDDANSDKLLKAIGHHELHLIIRGFRALQSYFARRRHKKFEELQAYNNRLKHIRMEYVKAMVQYGITTEDNRKQDLTRYKIRKTTREHYLIEKYGMRWFNKVSRREFRGTRPPMQVADRRAESTKPYGFIDDFLQKPRVVPRAPQPQDTIDSNFRETKPPLPPKRDATPEPPASLMKAPLNTSMQEFMTDLNKGNRTMDVINQNLAEIAGDPRGQVARDTAERFHQLQLEKRMKYIQDKLTTYNSDKLILGKLRERIKLAYSRDLEVTIQDIETRLRNDKNEIASLVLEIKRIKQVFNPDGGA